VKAAGKAASIRAHASLPIAVGFGISDPAQARAVAVEADGCGVGSAIVNQIGRTRDQNRRVCQNLGGCGENHLSGE